MLSVKDEFRYEIEIKKSTFIAYLVEISKFDELCARLKIDHKKAGHFVWAKRYFDKSDQIIEKSSDDGEPKGTGGPPILNVMRGSNLIECGVVVVRYFGGIKLGTGGLSRAYGACAKKVIEIAELDFYEKKDILKFYTVYSLVSRFEHFFENRGILFPKRAYQEKGIEWDISLSQSEKELFLDFALEFKRDDFREI